jgi:hypothetical protein
MKFALGYNRANTSRFQQNYHTTYPAKSAFPEFPIPPKITTAVFLS